MMKNFSPRPEEQSDDQLKDNINIHQPGFASLSSDELSRRSIDKLTKTTVELDKSNKKYTHALGMFALLQIMIGGLQLLIAIKNSQDVIYSVFIGIIFIAILVWFNREFRSLQ